MATEQCVHLHAQLQQPWAHCDQLHEHHNAHWREHCAVLSTPRTVFRCIAQMCSYVTSWLKSRLCVFISIHGHRHAHLFLSVLFFLVSLYLVLKSFFHLFLSPAMVPDENSMEDPLCDSSFGSMVTLDYVTPDTGFEPKDMELTDTNERNLATSSDIYFQNTLDGTASFPNVPGRRRRWACRISCSRGR